MTQELTTIESHSPAVQDYLRAIYQLAETGAEAEQVTTAQVTTSAVAERLNVRPASVTVMLQKMAACSPALVQYQKNYGARLTADGERAALTVIRYHRLLELYLHQMLGFGWDEVHEEADRLEHVISEDMAGRIAAALGHPTHDPHGHAIPSADLLLDTAAADALAQLDEDQPARVLHVRDEDPELLRYLGHVGLLPGAPVEIIARDDGESLLWARVGDGEPFSMSLDIAGQVFIERGEG